MKTIVIDLPERLTTEIGALIENGWFANETEIIQTALWEFMRRNRFALTEQFQRADIAWALQQHRNQQSQQAGAPRCFAEPQHDSAEMLRRASA